MSSKAVHRPSRLTPMAQATQLDELATRETTLVARLRETQGDEAEVRSEVSSGFSEVHRGYVELARSGNLEATHRAVFLWWYSLSEPPFLTGLTGLAKDDGLSACDLLEERCSQRSWDPTLVAALRFYRQVHDFLEPASRFPCLANSTVDPVSNAELRGVAKSLASADSGQLGDYWRSIANTAA